MSLDVYVDGSYREACSPGLCAGAGIYFGKNHPSNMHMAITCISATNSTIELVALYTSLLITKDVKKVSIHTDSAHCVEPLTSRYQEYCSNGWTIKSGKSISDSEIFIKCSSIIESRKQQGYITKIKKVTGHSNVEGNVAADALASQVFTGFKSYPNAIYASTNLETVIKHSFETNHGILRSANLLDNKQMKDEDVCKEVSQIQLETLDDKEETTGNDDLELETPPAEVVTNHIFLLCIRGGSMVHIKYPSSHPINSIAGIGELSESTMFITTCRRCMLQGHSGNVHPSLDKVASEIGESMNKLSMSPKFITTSMYAQCATKISGTDQRVLSSNGHVHHVSTNEISTKCDSKCVATSVDMEECCDLPYLKLGFL